MSEASPAPSGPQRGYWRRLREPEEHNEPVCQECAMMTDPSFMHGVHLGTLAIEAGNVITLDELKAELGFK